MSDDPLLYTGITSENSYTPALSVVYFKCLVTATFSIDTFLFFFDGVADATLPVLSIAIGDDKVVSVPADADFSEEEVEA